MTSGAGWWDAAFGDAYLAVYTHRDDASARTEAAFVVRSLGIVAGECVLDAGCGAGRHARSLAATGARVVGVDRSAALLAAAAAREGGPAYVAGDLRALPFRPATFAHVVSLFTSFGYFDDAGDRRQLAEFRRVVRAGGGLLLDFLNAPRVAATLVPQSERSAGAFVVREARSIRGGRVEKRVVVTDGARVVATWDESVRLWSRDELRSMLESAGFRVAGEHGGFDGSAWSVQAERFVVRAVAA